MRKVIYAINLTLDGCCDHTKGAGNAEIHNYFADLIQDNGLLVYGRITYQLMVPFWPDVARDQSMDETANRFARVFDAADKLVFSKTLDETEDHNTRIIRTDPLDEIRRLKQQPGKNILLGGVDLPSQLIAAGLVDEYYFVYQPILAGEGRRLLDLTTLPGKFELKLVESKIFKSGGVALHYVKQ